MAAVHNPARGQENWQLIRAAWNRAGLSRPVVGVCAGKIG
jgi:hypothetical protein